MPIVHPFEKLTDSLSVPAAVDLDAGQYHFMKYDGAGLAILCTAIGEKSIGVLQNDPVALDSAVIGTGGYTRVVAGAALARFDDVTPNAAARAITAVATNQVRGEAIIPAAADGDIITIRLKNLIA